jgi:hypothetical protein
MPTGDPPKGCRPVIRHFSYGGTHFMVSALRGFILPAHVFLPLSDVVQILHLPSFIVVYAQLFHVPSSWFQQLWYGSNNFGFM